MRLDDGFAETADQILDGTLPLVYDPLTNSLLTHLARVCPPLPIDFTDDTINPTSTRVQNVTFSDILAGTDPSM